MGRTESQAETRSNGTWLVVLAIPATVLASAIAAAAISDDRAVHPLLILFGLGIALLLALRPTEVILPLLILAVYANLSDVLVRSHGIPSLLQWVIIPLAALAWLVERRVSARNLLRSPLAWLLFAYNLLLLSSFLWADDPGVAERRWLENGKALVVFLLVALLVSSRKKLQSAVWTIAVTAAVLSGLAAFQAVTGSRESFGGLARVEYSQIDEGLFGSRAAGPVGDPNFFGQILLLALPLAFFAGRGGGPWAPWAGGALAALVSLGIFLTYSRGAVLALGVMLVMLLLMPAIHRRWIAPVALVAALALIVVPGNFLKRMETIGELFQDEPVRIEASVQKRTLVTRVAWRMFLEHPLLGVGAGNYDVRFEEIAESVGSSARLYDEPGSRDLPHSLYLEIAAETGVIGLLLFGGIGLVSLLRLYRSSRRSLAAGDVQVGFVQIALLLGLCGYLVAALFLHGEFQRYLWIILGLAVASERLRPGPAHPSVTEVS